MACCEYPVREKGGYAQAGTGNELRANFEKFTIEA